MKPEPQLQDTFEYERALALKGDIEGLAFLQVFLFKRAFMGALPTQTWADGVRARRISRMGSKWQTLKSFAYLCGISIKTLATYKNGRGAVFHYMIQPMSHSGTHQDPLHAYDRRSLPVLKAIPPDQTLNLMHYHNIRLAAENALNIKNPFYYEALAILFKPGAYIVAAFRHWRMRVAVPKPFDLPLRAEIESRARMISQSWILRAAFWYIRPGAVLMIDDSRHTLHLRHLSRRKNVKSICYMHGRFNEWHIGLFHEPPDFYLLWSDYYEVSYKKYMQQRLINHDIKFIQAGAFHLQNPGMIEEKKRLPESNDLTKRVLLIHEDNVNYDTLLPFLERLADIKNIEIYIKPKRDILPQALTRFSAKPLVSVLRSGTFWEVCQTHNIDIVCGTHSTALMESWLIGIPAIIFDIGLPYAQHMVEDGLCLIVRSPEEIEKTVGFACQMRPEAIKEFHDKLWACCPETSALRDLGEILPALLWNSA